MSRLQNFTIVAMVIVGMAAILFGLRTLNASRSSHQTEVPVSQVIDAIESLPFSRRLTGRCTADGVGQSLKMSLQIDSTGFEPSGNGYRVLGSMAIEMVFGDLRERVTATNEEFYDRGGRYVRGVSEFSDGERIEYKLLREHEVPETARAGAWGVLRETTETSNRTSGATNTKESWAVVTGGSGLELKVSGAYAGGPEKVSVELFFSTDVTTRVNLLRAIVTGMDEGGTSMVCELD